MAGPVALRTILGIVVGLSALVVVFYVMAFPSDVTVDIGQKSALGGVAANITCTWTSHKGAETHDYIVAALVDDLGDVVSSIRMDGYLDAGSKEGTVVIEIPPAPDSCTPRQYGCQYLRYNPSDAIASVIAVSDKMQLNELTPIPAEVPATWDAVRLSSLVYNDTVPEEVAGCTTKSWTLHKLVEDETKNVRAGIFTSGSNVAAVFRGTGKSEDIISDFRMMPRAQEYNGVYVGMVHSGFAEYYDLIQKSLVDAVSKLSLKKKISLILTGHSLGGALATLAYADLATNPNISARITSFHVPTFGMPRVGLEDFGFFVARELPTPIRRYVHAAPGDQSWDVISYLPPSPPYESSAPATCLFCVPGADPACDASGGSPALHLIVGYEHDMLRLVQEIAPECATLPVL